MRLLTFIIGLALGNDTTRQAITKVAVQGIQSLEQLVEQTITPKGVINAKRTVERRDGERNDSRC